jgi:hypothetical protein
MKCKFCNGEVVKCDYCDKDFVLNENIFDITIRSMGMIKHKHFHSDFCANSYLLGYRCDEK